MSCSKVLFLVELANNNGCGQYALIGVRLLFEGGHYNIQGLARGGYYSRAATIRGRRLIEEIRNVQATSHYEAPNLMLFFPVLIVGNHMLFVQLQNTGTRSSSLSPLYCLKFWIACSSFMTIMKGTKVQTLSVVHTYPCIL